MSLIIGNRFVSICRRMFILLFLLFEVVACKKENDVHDVGFPTIRQVTLQRLYDDNNNMLYICSHSDNHIFYSICPTQAKHITFNSLDQYNSDYFYYADKSNPSDLHKVVLPKYVNGVFMARRIKYVFEMSNEECLIEIENGKRYSANVAHHNLYRVLNVFSGDEITEGDVELSLSFDVNNSRISAFDQVQEYKPGCIVLAPYGSKKSAKVYITHNYGKNWDLIFCADDDNTTHYIKPKAKHLGDDNAYGVYPTAELLCAETPLDWDATGNENVHIHGIAYDQWYERIWICTGDGGSLENNVTGIWWTDDEGYTWKRIGGKDIIKTQIMGIIPMEQCVLFSSDGDGDGFWRWIRDGKDSYITIDNCYNYLGTRTHLVMVAGRSILAHNGYHLTSFAPDNAEQGDWKYAGGIVATYDGFSFEKIYEDNFTKGTFETAEIGWSCDITDCNGFLILKADKGGYIRLDYR